MNAQAERPDRDAGQAGAQPDEAQLRAAYEAELSRITSVDMVLQAAASLLNIGAHRLGLTGGDPAASATADRHGDLEQVRDAIDAVRGLMPVIERRAAREARPLRDALSQLQMAYARETQGATSAQAPAAAEQTPAGEGSPPAGTPSGGEGESRPGAGQPAASQPGGKPGPGPAESSGRLWVPGR
jgi:hypothetical protein